MASGETALYTRCPACSEPIELSATVKLDMKRVVVGIDTDPIRDHIATHHTPPTTSRPPTG